MTAHLTHQSIDWTPGMKNMRLKDLPTVIRITDTNEIMFDFVRSETKNCLNSSAIIFNTFDELEYKALEAISAICPRIYIIGPLPLLGRHVPNSQLKFLSSSLWKEDSRCFQWLDKREPKSIVYINYGSTAMMTKQHLKEFAWGLANSKHPFLWIVRPDVVLGDPANLPEDFLKETKDRGFLASWYPQE